MSLCPHPSSPLSSSFQSDRRVFGFVPSSCGLTLSASLCCCSGGSVVQACLFCPFLLSPGPCLNPPNPERALSHCSHPIKSQCPFCLCPFLKQLFLKKLLTLMAIPPHPDPLFIPLDARCIGNTRIRFCVFFFFHLKSPSSAVLLHGYSGGSPQATACHSGSLETSCLLLR